MFVTFDLDRVLIQNPFELGVFPEIRRKLAHHVDADHSQGVHPEQWVMQRIIAESAARNAAGAWVDAYDWDSIADVVAQEVNYPGQFNITEMVKSYCQPGYIATYPDVLPMLRRLHAMDIKMWWISNGFSRYQLPVTVSLGLQPMFAGFFAPDTAGAVKPQQKLFDMAVAAAGKCAARGVHVGDRLVDDVAGAKVSGMFSVLLERNLPQSLRDVAPLELPQLPLFRDYVTYAAREEGLADQFGIRIEQHCTPDAVITSLAQLPQVLDHLGWDGW